MICINAEYQSKRSSRPPRWEISLEMHLMHLNYSSRIMFSLPFVPQPECIADHMTRAWWAPWLHNINPKLCSHCRPSDRATTQTMTRILCGHNYHNKHFVFPRTARLHDKPCRLSHRGEAQSPRSRIGDTVRNERMEQMKSFRWDVYNPVLTTVVRPPRRLSLSPDWGSLSRLLALNGERRRHAHFLNCPSSWFSVWSATAAAAAAAPSGYHRRGAANMPHFLGLCPACCTVAVIQEQTCSW